MQCLCDGINGTMQRHKAWQPESPNVGGLASLTTLFPLSACFPRRYARPLVQKPSLLPRRRPGYQLPTPLYMHPTERSLATPASPASPWGVFSLPIHPPREV